MKNLTGLIICMMGIILCSCIKEGPLKRTYEGFSPGDIADGWSIAVPSQVQIDSMALDGIYRDLYVAEENWMVKSLLVFRNGKLISEAYFKTDSDRTQPDAIWSCTKQITSLITGLALESGLIRNLEDPISDYLPEIQEKYPDKKDIRISHLLTMKSGLEYDNGTDNDSFKQELVDNSVDFILSRPLVNQPG